MNWLFLLLCVSSIWKISAERTLFTCSSACADACTQDIPNGSCTSCSLGFYSDYYNNGLCVQFCDGSQSSTGGICDNPSSGYFDYRFPTLSNPIYPQGFSDYQALISSVSSTTGSLLYNPAGPYPVQSSGFWFPSSGTGYIQLPPNSATSSSIILGNHFHIAIYVLPKPWSNEHCIFAKEGSNYISLSLYITSNLDLHVVYTTYDTLTTASQQIDTVISSINSFDAWNLVEIHADYSNSQLGVYVNGNPTNSLSISNSFFADDDTETFSVGKSLINNQGFYGVIYEVLIVYNSNSYGSGNNVFSYSDDCNWANRRCAGYPEFNDVVSACTNLDEYFIYNSGSSGCNGCVSSCTYGCIQGQTCILNYDLLCRDSIGYSSSECTACCGNCEPTTNPCTCLPNHGLNNDGTDCIPCSLKCNGCYNSHVDSCNACASGNYKIAGTDFCIGECPAGYEISGSDCASTVNDGDLALRFWFGRIGNVIEDELGGYKAFMGSSWDYSPNFDENDPIPAYQQGLYFDGNSYAMLPPNPADRNSLILGNDYLLCIWIRPYETEANSYILSKEGSYINIALYLSQTMELKIQYTCYDDQSLAPSSGSFGSSTIASKTWAFVLMTVTRDYGGHHSTLMLQLNDNYDFLGNPNWPMAQLDLYNNFLEDFATDKFYLGASIVNNQYFKGFIYEIWLFKKEAWVYWDHGCECDYCGGMNGDECLGSCDFNQYYNYTTDACESCDSSCSNGCLRSGDCSLNQDPLCIAATGYKYDNCTQCIDGAKGAGDKCACDLKHEQVGNECQWCVYHMQDRNTISYFSDDYLSVVVEFEQPIDIAMPDKCESLLISSSLEDIGVGPDCHWNEDRTAIFIKLGENATVLEGSRITFIEGVLMTYLHACGGPKIEVHTNISKAFQVPLVYPSPIFFVPSKLYAECNDLVLDASKSTGGYGRALSYKWDFSSNPQILTLSSNSGYINATPYITIDRSSLSQTVGNITLTVTNWLGLSAATSKSIDIINSTGLYLYYDATIPFKLKTSEYKSIEVYTSIGCEATGINMLLYSWSISQSIGPYTKIDEEALWNSQTVPTTLYSPPAFFGPGVYKFQLIVTSNTNVSAFIEFNLTYLASDLIVNLPTNVTLLYPNNLTVSPEVTDPDSLPGSFAYTWTCHHNDYDCSSIIANNKNLTLNVAASNLMSETSYVFTFTASKSTRKTTKSINVKVTKRNISNFTFSTIPDCMNINQNFVIWAYPNVSDVYDSYWKVLEGSSYKRIGDSNANSLGFQAGSLIPFQNYTIKYTLSDIHGFTTYYLNFTTNKYPIPGQFKITPSTGIEYQTLFNLTANKFSSPDSGSLEYQFGYYLNDHEIPLNIKNESTFHYGNLPFSQSLTVFVKVYDKRGWYQMFTEILNVTENSAILGADAISELEMQLDKVVEFPSLINGINKITQKVLWNPEANSTDLKKARDLSLNATNILLDSLYHFDSESFHTIVELLDGIFSGPNNNVGFTIKQRDLTFLILDTLMEKAKNISIYVSESTVVSIANICDRSSDLSPSSLDTDSNLVDHINQILKDLLVRASDYIPIGSSINIDTNFIHIQSQLKNSNSIKGYEGSMSGYGGVSVPSNMNFSAPEGIIATLHILIAYDDSNREDSDSYPRGLEFLIVAITLEDKYPISFDISPNFFNLTIPFYAKTISQPIKCYFYKDNEWITDGCQFVSFTYPQVLCQCSHTSLYSAGWGLETVTVAKQWYAPFYYSCSLSGIYFIVAGVLFLLELRHKVKGISKIYLTGIVMPFKGSDKDEENSNKISKFPYSTEEDQLFIKRNEMESHAEAEQIAIKHDESKEDNKKDNGKIIGMNSPISSIETATMTAISNLPPEMNFDNFERKRWTWYFRYHYFISFIFFSFLYFSRMARFTLFMTSLIFQVFLCGIFADFYGSGELSTVNPSFIEVSLGLWHFLFALAAPVVTNILILGLESIMSGRKRKVHPNTETFTTKVIKYKNLIGYLICIFVICFNVVAAYFIAEDCDGNASRVWLKMVILGFAFDAIVVQGIKVVISVILEKIRARRNRFD